MSASSRKRLGRFYSGSGRVDPATSASGGCRRWLWRRRRRHVVPVLPLLGLLACSPDPMPRHLVAIVVDTLRADALGLYGNPRGTSPNLDSLARESVVFEHAWAQGTYTLSSYLSYMSSTHIRGHGLDFSLLYVPKAGVCGWDDIEMLAEVLARNGFRNEALVANPVLQPWKGFARGFHDWNGIRLDEPHEGDTNLWLQFWLDDGRVVEEAEAAIERWEGDRSQFLYLHFMDPHPPLDPSPAGREAVGAPEDWAPGGRLDRHWVRELRERGTPEQKERVRDGYLASVWDADGSVGSILRAVEESGHADDTVVVFFADHGEQIWEHGDHGHARGVWEELARVPLLIRIPGRPPERVDRAVGLLDLAPTLLKLFGIEEFPGSWQGSDLFEPDGRIVVSQRFRRTAVIAEGRTKGILGPWRGGIGWRYFDLESDPGERRALANAEGAESLRKGYELWAAGVPRVTRDRGEQPVGICVTTSERRDHLEEDALRALGYIQ